MRVIASERLKRRFSAGEIRHLGKIMMQMDREGEHPTGLAAIRAMLLTGFRRMEVLGMHEAWIEPEGNCVAFPDTKSGPQLRGAGDAAIAHLLCQAQRSSLRLSSQPIGVRAISSAPCACSIGYARVRA